MPHQINYENCENLPQLKLSSSCLTSDAQGPYLVFLQIGSFVVSGEDASYMTCGRGIHNSITHRKSSSKSRVVAQWRAPNNFEGEVSQSTVGLGCKK